VQDRNKRKEMDRQVDREVDRMIDRGRGIAEEEGEVGRWGPVQHIEFDYILHYY